MEQNLDKSVTYVVKTKFAERIQSSQREQILLAAKRLREAGSEPEIASELEQIARSTENSIDPIGDREVFFMGPYGDSAGLDDRSSLIVELETIQRNIKLLARIFPKAFTGEEISEIQEIGAYGVSGDNPQPAAAKVLLQNFKSRLSWKLSIPVRVKHLVELSKVSCLVSSIFGVPAALSFWINVNVVVLQLSGFCAAISGASLGLLLLNLSKPSAWSFEEVLLFVSNGSRPIVRMLAVTLVAIAITTFCNLNLIQLSIGSIRTSDLASHPAIAFTVGIMVGCSDGYFVKMLIDKSTKVTDSKT